MQGPGGGKTLKRTGRLAFVVGPQQIAAIVTQEIGGHTGGTLHGGRHVQFLRDKGRLFAALYFPLQVQQLPNLPGVVQIQSKGNFRFCPAGAGDLTGGQQLFIILCQSLQDHRNTSQFCVSSTPCSSRARK